MRETVHEGKLMVHIWWCLCLWLEKCPSRVSQASLRPEQSLLYVFGCVKKRPKITPSQDLLVRDRGKTSGVWTRRMDSALWGLRDIRCHVGIRDNVNDDATEGAKNSRRQAVQRWRRDVLLWLPGPKRTRKLWRARTHGRWSHQRRFSQSAKFELIPREWRLVEWQRVSPAGSSSHTGNRCQTAQRPALLFRSRTRGSSRAKVADWRTDEIR